MTAALWHQFGDQVPKLLYGISENCLLKRDLSSKHITWCLQGVSTKSCRGINRFSHPPGGEAFPSARVSSLITKEGETHWKKKPQTLQTNTCTFGGDFNPFCYSNGSFCILQNPSCRSSCAFIFSHTKWCQSLLLPTLDSAAPPEKLRPVPSFCLCD